mgnify:CR=1 FL=1
MPKQKNNAGNSLPDRNLRILIKLSPGKDLESKLDGVPKSSPRRAFIINNHYRPKVRELMQYFRSNGVECQQHTEPDIVCVELNRNQYPFLINNPKIKIDSISEYKIK